MKKCANTMCQHKGVLLPMINFYRRIVSKDGYETECKDCKRIKQLKYQEKARAARIELKKLFV
jgi:hypothetical protein